MSFLVEAHLLRHLALLLREYSYDAIPTLGFAGRKSIKCIIEF